jgi:hypothetical protein
MSQVWTPKKFLFDLDETLYVGDLIFIASCMLTREKLIDRIYTGKDVTKFPDMDGVPDIVREKTIELFSDPIYGAVEKTPIAGAFNMLEVLSMRNNHIGVLTARPQCIRKATEFALWRDFPHINIEILFANTSNTGCKSVSKTKLLKQFNPDYYFDDHFEYCKEAKKTCPNCNVFMISNSHTRWNQEISSLSLDTIKKIKSINDFDMRGFLYGV